MLDPNFVIQNGSKFLTIGVGAPVDFNKLPRVKDDRMLLVIVENQSFRHVNSTADLGTLIQQTEKGPTAAKHLEFLSLPKINLG